MSVATVTTLANKCQTFNIIYCVQLRLLRSKLCTNMCIYDWIAISHLVWSSRARATRHLIQLGNVITVLLAKVVEMGDFLRCPTTIHA